MSLQAVVFSVLLESCEDVVIDAPVVFLRLDDTYTGAEEIGLLGAHGFASLHPIAREIAYAVNLESGGVGGKEIIVQVSLL